MYISKVKNNAEIKRKCFESFGYETQRSSQKILNVFTESIFLGAVIYFILCPQHAFALQLQSLKEVGYKIILFGINHTGIQRHKSSKNGCLFCERVFAIKFSTDTKAFACAKRRG